jgi:DNA-binding LytR/AlgR family response regulator
MKCLIIDDEPLAIKVLESHIKNVDFLEISSTFFNAVDAYNYLQKNKVDLLFLDINMPRLTGLEFLKTLTNPPQVILTTAYREFALDGYEFNVKDYLLKPISFERFLKAVGKVRGEVKEVAMPVAPASGNDEPRHIFIKSNKKMVKVYFRDILFIESIKDYVKVKTDKIEVISNQRISGMEEILPKDSFLRIHKSFIINLTRIDSFSNSFVEINKKELPIGRLYKNEALKVLMKEE